MNEGNSTGGVVGARTWAIAEGCIPSVRPGEELELESHEAACMLNPGNSPAKVEVTIYFAEREPAGPYHLTVPAWRMRHVHFDELMDPEPIPRDTLYAAVIDSDEPIVVQHTRLDSRWPALALPSATAHPS